MALEDSARRAADIGDVGVDVGGRAGIVDLPVTIGMFGALESASKLLPSDEP